MTLRGERRVEGQPQLASQDAGTMPPEHISEEDVEEREARVEDRVAHHGMPQVVAERLGLGDGRARRRRRGRDGRDRREGHGHGDLEGVAGLEVRGNDDVHELAVDVVLDRVAG